MLFFSWLRRNKQSRKPRKIKGTLKQSRYYYEHANELSPAIKPEYSLKMGSLLEKAAKDTFTTGVVAGILGLLAMHLSSWAWKSAGIIDLTTLQVSAAIFLTPSQIDTLAGTIVGILAHIMVGSAGGVLLAYFIKFSGKEFFWLKGLGLSGFMLLVGMGLIVRIMDITPEMRADSTITLVHFFNYFIYGLVVAYVIYKFGRFGQEDLNKRG